MKWLMEMSVCGVPIFFLLTLPVAAGLIYGVYRGGKWLAKAVKNPNIDWTTSFVALFLVVLGYWYYFSNVTWVNCGQSKMEQAIYGKPSVPSQYANAPCTCGCGRHK